MKKRTKKLDRKAQSHIEIMLSFVIFIGFLLFVFIFLNPFAKTEKPNYIMDNIQRAIINNITDGVGKLSVITNGTSCYDFTAADYNGNYREVDQGNGKFIIYFNSMFNDYSTKKGGGGCSLNYTLGTYSEEKIVTYNRTKNLKNAYISDYDRLKLSLGITDDFLFKIQDLNGFDIDELSTSKNIPQVINVESRDIPIRVIYDNGNIRELILNIKAW